MGEIYVRYRAYITQMIHVSTRLVICLIE